MMIMKGEERINNILNDFFKEFDCEVCLDTDFAYYSHKNLITYTFICGNTFDVLFNNVINLLCPYIKCDLFLWSLFHELGHHETIDNISDEDYAYCQDEKERIAQALSGLTREENEKKYDNIANSYFFLPDEIAATAWAIDFVTKNTYKVKKLWNKLQPAIMDFYQENEVEMED